MPTSLEEHNGSRFVTVREFGDFQVKVEGRLSSIEAKQWINTALLCLTLLATAGDLLLRLMHP